MPGATVTVVGMKALRRDLNRMSTEISGPVYAALKQAGKQTAEPVAARARGAIVSDTGSLEGSIRTSGTKTGGAVRMGSRSVPYAGWVEFGGSRPDGSSRQYMKDGRYLFPAGRSLADESARNYSAALERIFASDSLWTNTGTSTGAVHD